MNIDNLTILIKFTFMNMFICYIFFRIINYKKIYIPIKILLLFISVSVAFFELAVTNQMSSLIRMILIYIIYSLFLGYLTNTKIGISLIITTISISISNILFYIVALFLYVIAVASNISYKNPILTLILFATVYLMIYLFFRIKRFRNGFTFIKNRINNSFIDIFVLVINIIIVFLCFVLENFYSLSSKQVTIGIFILGIVLLIILQKTFQLYQKLKLQTNALKDTEKALKETEQKLETALQEKQKLVKSNHEFYHRQEALKKKLDDLIKQQSLNMSTEFGEDFGDLLQRINTLSDEYTNKIATVPKLPKTNIVEIDDMLTYMQSECINNNIEFILKIECDINYILNNFISKSQLETLLGDLLRNAIIAINHNSIDYRSIMVVFGIKDDSYELCVFDSGIPFEIITLQNLGLKPASTHENEGGTGIGFITTFETLNACRASFIIDEITNNNYTKSLEIKFDGRHEYVIISHRNEEIGQMNNAKRNIILREK